MAWNLFNKKQNEGLKEEHEQRKKNKKGGCCGH